MGLAAQIVYSTLDVIANTDPNARNIKDRETDTGAEFSVHYNAECPIRAREIDHYARHAGRHALPIRFDPLNGADLTAYVVSEDVAARSLHVLHQGRVVSGVPAFLLLWQAMPGYRWLGRVVGVPWVRHAAAGIYDHVLAPALYRMHLRRQTHAR